MLALNDYKVGITGRRTELLEKLKSEKPESFFIKSFDIRDINIVESKFEELTNELGGLDLMIISSGTGEINKQLDFDLELPTIETNITGFTCIADLSFRFFEKQKSGHLAAISSIGGLRGSMLSPAYNASKAYQINYLEGLRQKAVKLKEEVYVTDIRPGFVDTDMAKGDGLFWVMPVDVAAKQIYKAIIRKRKIAYVTKRWYLAAILLKLIPGFIYDRMRIN